MPILINYNSNENIIYTKAEGLIYLNDILSYFASIATLDTHDSYRVLADYSEAVLKLSINDIHEMSRRRSIDSNTNKPIKIAVYCSEDLVFRIGRMYKALVNNEKYDVMIFRDENKTKEWLGI